MNITKVSIDEVEELKNFVKKMQAVPEWATILSPKSNGVKDNLDLRLSPDEVIEVSRMLEQGEKKDRDRLPEKKKRQRETKKFLKNRLFNCGAGKNTLVINPYGEMNVCLKLPFPGYQILEGGIKESWERIVHLVKSTKPSSNYRCPECELSQYCSSCPAKAWLECADLNSCPTYYRQMAEKTAVYYDKKSRV